ncbi:MAG: hypothetical protein P1U64_14360 [Alcanivoracaceae bacterium]|nr:hypothetical protein [Alcanivoracaceae bacterium]
MKGFKKLALASAIAALPVSGFAMEAMDDAALSDVTGQDGLSLNIDVPASTMDIIIHDGDGSTAGSLTGVAGALVINNMSLSTGAGGIDVDIDADGGATGAPVLNVAVTIPTGTTINTGDIQVAGSSGMGNAVTNTSANILDSMSITLGQVDLNIQLGSAEPQGSMIVLDTAITNGITINNFALNDASSGESISVSQIVMEDADGSGNLTVSMTGDVETSGLALTFSQLGATAGTVGVSLQMSSVQLGTAPAIGDIEIIGLNLNGTTVTIAGKN